jgi:hypothetical protein
LARARLENGAKIASGLLPVIMAAIERCAAAVFSVTIR